MVPNGGGPGAGFQPGSSGILNRKLISIEPVSIRGRQLNPQDVSLQTGIRLKWRTGPRMHREES